MIVLLLSALIVGAIRAVCSSASSAAATGLHPLDHVRQQWVPQVGHQRTDGLGLDIVDDDATCRSSPTSGRSSAERSTSTPAAGVEVDSSRWHSEQRSSGAS